MALGLLAADAPAEVYGVPQNWPRWAVSLPHVLAATRTVRDDPDELGEAAVLDCVELLHRAGTYLLVHGRACQAGPLAERALTLVGAVHGPDHPDVATALSNLATVLSNLGDPATARPLLERALTITEAAHGPDHPDVATALGNLAAVLRNLGDPATARPLGC